MAVWFLEAPGSNRLMMLAPPATKRPRAPATNGPWAPATKGPKGADERRHPSQVPGLNPDNELTLHPPQTRLTGEIWTVIIHHNGEPDPDKQTVELECGYLNI
ncbi:uncharacterized protein LOC120699051 [Panicum virgatum]|uniref:uncharacterized protein LOC120699051 n=1 Tax=Panicum virgatum TaxID=38727 RepID=UPI0019D6294F|nr:uncharacterized protein LOC120699051 [Panicum virgatum]